MTCVTWAVNNSLVPGQTFSGDQYVVCEIPEGALIGVVDGLGHGEEAAAAALTATAFLKQNATSDLVSLIRACHDRLKPTRGAVMSLAFFNSLENKLSWIGVGNVEGVVLGFNGEKHCKTLLMRSGVVGQQLPGLQVATIEVQTGDTLILATDGIREGFVSTIHNDASPKDLAERILSRHSKGSDDALVLVARYEKKPEERS